MLSKENIEEQVIDNQSRLIRMKKEDALLSSSQQILQLPEGFTIGKAIGEGDCFFDAVAQGLKQLKPGTNFTVKSLRAVCRKQALSSQEMKEKIIADARNRGDSKVVLPEPDIDDEELYKTYLIGIEYTAEDIEGMETQDPQLYKSLTSLKYGSTLQVPIWGRPEIEGRMICNEYNVKLHVIENLPHAGWSNQLVDGLASRSINCVDYSEENTIHVINKRGGHFEPILRESPVSSRVADFSSIDSGSVWHSTLTDCRSTLEMANDMGLIDDEIVKRATFFVKTFVEEFEEELSKFSKEAKPGSKARKSGKIVEQSASAVNNFIPPGWAKLAFAKLCEGLGCFSAAEHRKGAKKISATVTPFKNEIREILVEASLEVFQSFESQFTKIEDTAQLHWERGIEKLAIDAVSRVINYILFHSQGEKFPVDLITKGVVLGKSKRKCLFTIHSGYLLKDKQDGKILVTSKLYRGVGIVKIDNDITEYYQSTEYDCAKKYGYRLPFAWELEKWWEVNKKYMLVVLPEKEEYVRILDGKKKEELSRSILKEINGNDPTKKKDIEKLCEEIRNWQIKKEESICPFFFNLGPLPRLFIKRRRMLVNLASMLDKESQELEMSRMVLISGRHGTGKSELAKSYAHDKENGTWKNIIWIDATMPSTISSLFYRLAQKLGISIEKGKGIQTIDVKVKTERQQEEKIVSIIEDIYKNFRDAKSLFIFDNVSNYKDIEEFLPSHFFYLFVGKEKPYVLITSSSKNWTEEIEKIVLDEGFTLPEAIDFIETALGIDGRLCNADSITELAKTLNYSPLALKRATKHIKEEGISISQYLERYNKAMQELNLDRLKAQNIPLELLITLKIGCNKIKEEDVGQQSHEILDFMSYLGPGKIDTVEFFFQEKSEKDQQSVSDALNLLDKFSVIELEESIAIVHMEVQKTIRLEKEQAGTEEETLRKIMKSFMDSGTTNVSHIISVWSYVSKYEELVDEFIDSLYDGNTILHLLAKDGNEEVIKLIFEKSEKKVDPNKLSKIINAVDKRKCTPLDYAAMHGYLEIVKYFIQKGSDLEGDNRDLTPLHWASVCGQLEVVKYFLDDKYWDVNKLSGEDGTPLHYAVISGNIDVVRYLLEKKADVDLQDENAGPLHYAVQEGHLDIVQCLIEGGASVNLHDRNGMYPLHYAVKNSFSDIVEYLIEKGANVNLQDRDGMGPLHYAVKNSFSDIVEYLIEKGANVNLQDRDGMGPLHYAVINDDIDVIQYLVKKEADIDLQDKKGVSPLSFAIKHNRSNTAKYLMMQNTIINLQNKGGLSPLCHATESDGLGNVKRLLRKKVIANLCKKNVMSSLYYGTESNKLDIAKCLIEEKVSMVFNQCDENSMSSLCYNMMRSIIMRRTMIDPWSKKGMSLLHFAVAYGHSDVIDHFVANGNNIDEQNEEGMSPLHIAVINAHLGSVKCLIKKGANINLQDKYGISPFFYALAITIYCPEVVFYLIKHSSFLIQKAQSSALDLKVQSHKRPQKRSAYFSEFNKKRKLEDVSATSKENTSNIQLLQDGQNLQSDISMQLEGLASRLEGLASRMESMVDINSEIPAYSFNSVAVESVNNKNLRI